MIIFGCVVAALVNYWIFGIGGNVANLIIGTGCAVAAVGLVIAEMS